MASLDGLRIAHRDHEPGRSAELRLGAIRRLGRAEQELGAPVRGKKWRLANSLRSDAFKFFPTLRQIFLCTPWTQKKNATQMKRTTSFAQESAASLLTLLAAIAITSKVSAQPATASLGGRVVEDLTGNGTSAEDRLIQGRVVRLFRDNGDGGFNAASDTLVNTDTTRRDGTYAFRNLAAGTYFVQQELPAFWVQTAPPAPEPDEIITPAQCGQTPRERNDTIPTAIPTGLSSATPGTYIACGVIGDNNYHELDVDFFKVQMNAGDVLQVDIDAAAFGSSLDSILRIFEASGHPVAEDDDAIGGGTDSHLEFFVNRTDTYYVGVSGFFNQRYDPFIAGSGRPAETTGDYTIEIKVGPQPPANPIGVTLAPSEQRTDVDLASSRLGTILGQMFVDIDGDGVHDAGEPGVNGQRIFLDYQGTAFGFDLTRSIDLNGDGIIDPATESGWYSFESLRPGIYITANLFSFGFGEAGWTQVSPSLDRSVLPCAGEVSSGPASDPGVSGLVPDLTVDPANGLCDWFVIGDVLHFGQATPNIGLGPMELRGGEDLGNGSQIVYQRIYQNTALTSFVDVEAGTFTFHPEHGHIHFDDYARYSLRQALPDSNGDGVPEVGAVVAGGQKTSFCLVDVAPYDLTLPNAAQEASGFGCGTTQRISVGWEDIYDPTTPGQQIDIAGLAPGQYWLEAVVDPDNHLRESNENNNIGRTLVSLGLGAPGAPAGSHGVQLTSGQTAADRDFALFQLISISGQVFNDLNGNGQQNNKEHGLNGWIVFLDLNGDGVLNNPEGDGLATALAREPWAMTDNQGNYMFAALDSGSFPVRLVPRAGWTQTTANPAPIAAHSGQNVSGVKFGLVSASGLTAVINRALDESESKANR